MSIFNHHLGTDKEPQGAQSMLPDIDDGGKP